jgi:hypothetical protein
MDETGSCAVVSIDVTTGVYTLVLTIPTCVAEPMFASDVVPQLFAFTQNLQHLHRQLIRVELTVAGGATYEVVQTYADNYLVSGVTRLN